MHLFSVEHYNYDMAVAVDKTKRTEQLKKTNCKSEDVKGMMHTNVTERRKIVMQLSTQYT